MYYFIQIIKCCSTKCQEQLIFLFEILGLVPECLALGFIARCQSKLFQPLFQDISWKKVRFCAKEQFKHCEPVYVVLSIFKVCGSVKNILLGVVYFKVTQGLCQNNEQKHHYVTLKKSSIRQPSVVNITIYYRIFKVILDTASSTYVNTLRIATDHIRFDKVLKK